MIETDLYWSLLWVMLGLGAATFVALTVIVAPYGRHQRRGWGPTIPSRVGWIVMESPAVLAFVGIFALGEHRAELVPLLLLGLWQIHYVHRTFVFPFRMRSEGKRIPILIVLLALAFNCLNAYLNARWLSELGSYATSWLTDPRFLVGVFVFAAGFAINVRADSALIALRGPGNEGYGIPRGRLHDLVSCPNYLGEILEWIGWAVAAWSPAGLAFAFFTAANLVPRALSNHRWYKATFPDYPARRKALIPFVL
jgi:hypothetical protein